ncbi:SpoIIE family protein phosphatase [Streptomyces sp. SP2-10]|uniref:SpoIIE family protein phosphatase n=1 Tax=Streptomyces sp. SP2-10 TaxID=2873385 RepID=UPI001CA681CD|nr:SpoIIE family protein phosphatase [Streptomyces sp. SP2-10]MBY8841932.1 SpoIIE family protein phosphatase [Streptomyces sp. SP2-10]
MNAEQLPPPWLFPPAQAAHVPRTMGADPFLRLVDGVQSVCECGFLRGIIEGTSAPVIILDRHLRHLYVNPAWSRVTGVPATTFLGRTLAEVLPDVQRPDDVLIEVLADGRPREVTLSGTTRVPSPVGRRLWRAVFHRLEVQGQVVGVCGIAVEVSNLRQYLDDLENAHQRLALLDAATTRVGTTLDVEATCAELAHFLAPSLADIAAVGIVEEEFFGVPPPPPGMLRLRKMELTVPAELQRHLSELGGPKPYIDLPRGSAPRRCIDSGRPWLGNLTSDELFEKVVADPDRLRIYRAAGVHSVLIVPLPTAGRSVGVVLLMRMGASPSFSNDDILTAQGVAARAAVSIDSAHRYSHEHTMTLELQRALLSEPDRPHPTVEVATRYLPSGRSALVGGDWYDSIALPDCRTLLVMGDVMGHGFQAAVAMSQYRSVLRTVAAAGLPVDAMLSEADRRAARIGLDRVATCLLVLMDPEAGTCTAATAGHLPPLVIRPNGSTGLMHLPAGPPIGTELGEYEMTTFAFEPGSVLLLYTDGLVEQRGVDIDDSVRALSEMGLSADDSLDHLLDTLLSRLTHGMCEDDIALLAARLRRPSTPRSRHPKGPPGPGGR